MDVAERGAQIAREERGAQAVRRAVRERDRVLEIVGDECAEHGAEQLALRERRLGIVEADDERREVEAAREARIVRQLAAEEARRLRVVDGLLDTRARLLADERPHGGRWIIHRSERKRLHLLAEPREKVLLDV